MPLITSSLAQDVRDLIDVTLDDATLPWTTISRAVFAGRAEAWATGRDPNISSYGVGSAPLQRAVNAALLYCAALLVPVVPRLKSELRGQDESYTREPIDVEERQRELLAQAEAEIALNLPVVGVSIVAVPSIFTVAEGYRGR